MSNKNKMDDLTILTRPRSKKQQVNLTLDADSVVFIDEIAATLNAQGVATNRSDTAGRILAWAATLLKPAMLAASQSNRI